MKWALTLGSLAAVALLQAAQAGPAVVKVCVPNDSWKEDCNDCICSEAGAPMCTTRECAATPGAAPTSSTLPPGAECTPGTVWREHCNSCRCTLTGRAVCTQMACLGDLDGMPGIEPFAPQPMPDHTMRRTTRARRPLRSLCREGQTWKEDCNSCWCQGGQTACTMMACPGLGASGAGTGLEEPSLLPAATGRHAAVALPAPLDGGRPVPLPAPLDGGRPVPLPARHSHDECTPGETWKEECNSCRCINGQAACTMVRCVTKRSVAVPAPARRICEPGDVWKDECNTCRCGPSGDPACTKMRCIKTEELHQEASPRTRRAPQYDPFPPQGHRAPGMHGCTSGTTWKQDCNTCHCINGREVCTFALCVSKQDQ